MSIEPVVPGDPALDHLWRVVSSPGRFQRGPGTLEPAIEALIAAGALDAAAPELGRVRAVEAALHHFGGEATPVPDDLGEPWRSLLGRRDVTDGAVGTVVIGAVTPLFDGFSVAAISLAANGSGFDVSVEVTPGGMLVPFDSDVSRPRLAWWALDDLGNAYLGQIGAWGGGGDRDQGDIGFSPALDPHATRLDLMPTARALRAVIRVPLSFGGPRR